MNIMRNFGGRPRALTPEQEQRVYAEVTATRRGRRGYLLSNFAREFGCAVSTLERAVAKQRPGSGIASTTAKLSQAGLRVAGTKRSLLLEPPTSFDVPREPSKLPSRGNPT